MNDGTFDRLEHLVADGVLTRCREIFEKSVALSNGDHSDIVRIAMRADFTTSNQPLSTSTPA
jgi:hypothetical protein